MLNQYRTVLCAASVVLFSPCSDLWGADGLSIEVFIKCHKYTYMVIKVYMELWALWEIKEHLSI